MPVNLKDQTGSIVVDVWGDFAMFTQPAAKVERVSYSVPTPSALRGILNAIYSKPIEFYYQITGFDIMRPVKTISIKKNETKDKVDPRNPKPIIQIAEKGNHGLTQRSNIYLKDVYYRIYAEIVRRSDFDGNNICALVDQFNKRIEKGKCFYQPCLGTRECMCFFSPINEEVKALDINEKFGVMLYDVFDIRTNTPLNTDPKNIQGHTDITFYNAVAEHGHVQVPSYESDEIYRKG